MSINMDELLASGLDSLPDLLGSAALVQHLEATLAQLEKMQGGTDAEARDLINTLKQQTAMLQGSTSSSTEGPTIESQLESLEAQLQVMETNLAAADSGTLQMLSDSVAQWINPGAAAAATADRPASVEGAGSKTTSTTSSTSDVAARTELGNGKAAAGAAGGQPGGDQQQQDQQQQQQQ